MHAQVHFPTDLFNFLTDNLQIVGPLACVAFILGSGLGWAVKAWVANRRFHRLEADYIDMHRESFLNRRIVENTSDGLLITKMNGEIVWVNPAYCAMMQRRAEDMIGQNPLTFALPPEDQPTDDQIRSFRFDPHDEDEIGLVLRRNIRANGEVFWNQINVAIRHAPDGTENAILSCRDITEQVEREQELETVKARLEYMVAHDDLTGLANRAELLRFTEEALSEASASGHPIGMLKVDLDRFKELNDTHGHPAGDRALVHVAQMMRGTLRKSDLVARLGGDEFVVVCRDISTLEELETIATALGRACLRPFAWADGQLKVGASFGAALSDPTGDTVEDLLQHSDYALYEAKRQGRGNVASYDDTLRSRFVEQRMLGNRFIEAVQKKELSFHFQPVLNLSDSVVTGFETLVRWNHPERGVISPAILLPMAQQLGLMAELDLAAMEAAIQTQVQLRNAGHPGIRFGVNASTEALLHPDYLDRLDGLTGIHGIEPQTFAIEVLETVILSGSRHAERQNLIVTGLYDRGYQTMLDDFGTGHAGLAHLAQHNFRGVKLDRTLVSQMLDDDISRRIVRSIIDLCLELGIKLIAEGVEDHDTAACLRDMGCEAMQGYWLSRPMPQEDVINWYETYLKNPLVIGPYQATDISTDAKRSA